MADDRDTTAEFLKQIACEVVDKHSEELRQINKKIWENPELNFEEHLAHGVLTEFFEGKGFDVTRHWTLDTAFSARYGGTEGQCVGVICEYDALPVVGHACGHNLIAEAGVGAALGIRAALEASGNKFGRLLVLGTPAEEGGGGKVKMIDSGCFKDIDFSMMVHPSKFDAAAGTLLSIDGVDVTYKGHAAHAAAFPWEGTNALDAAVMAYSSISMLRQQMKPAWRIHGVIHEGGVKPNIIPDKTRLEYYMRAPNEKELDELREKVVPCFEAAAKATGCTVEIKWQHWLHYSNVNHNPKLVELYKGHAESLGIKFLSKEEEAKLPHGSTDMGNVSYEVPSIHPFYSIGTTAPNHSLDFTAAAATDTAHKKTLIAAKSMAMTAIDVLCNPDILTEIKKQFQNSKQK